jgi:hypothetical protein
MNNSFTKKRLRVTLILADSANISFTSTGDNTLILTDNRISARVQSNARQATQMNLKIWGMTLADMDAMTAAWIDPNAIRNNIVILEADGGDGFRPVFTGTILEAQPDFRSAPDVPFQILATIRYFQQIQVVEPLSYKGDVDIAVLGRYLAQQLGMNYDQSPNVKATLTDPYFPGSLWTQLNNVCKAARVDYYFQGDKLVFAPISEAFDTKPAVVLSPDTGLLGYPVYTRRGLNVMAIFDPAFLCGTAIEIRDSLVKGANGRWYPYSIDHALEAELPNGKWISSLQCLRAGQ